MNSIHENDQSRGARAAELVRELGAEFLNREANRTALITVTGASVSEDLRRATLLITVLPEEKEHEALDFAKRKRGELREYLKKNMRSKNVPFVDIEIDQGEKNRQKIDDLLKK
ncbi:MAG TPA: ribosome-binding factor A [Candidatus Paceibacterota bacterium]|jgi:ribosome-binding factor A|nr:ribosome-binding factor A [Candidatus Paceibacterota bacterium]